MHHYFEAITNTAGQSLIGYFARVINPATQAVVTLASDNNGTPISVVSGVADMAKTDDFGNISLYVDPGTYNLEIFGPDATSFLFRVANVAMNSSKGDQGDPGPAGDTGASDSAFLTLAALKAVNPAKYPSPRLAAPSGADGGVANGLFSYQTGNYTGRTDVVQVNGIPLTTGALVRQPATSLTFRRTGSPKILDLQAKAALVVHIEDFGAVADGTTDSTAAFELAFSTLPNGQRIQLQPGKYILKRTLVWNKAFVFMGAGREQCEINFAADGNYLSVAGGSRAANIFPHPSVVGLVDYNNQPITGYGGRSTFHGVRFSGTAGMQANTSGMFVAAPIYGYESEIVGFTGDGIHVDAGNDRPTKGNANGCTFTNVNTQLNALSGFALIGNDVNRCILTGCNSAGNGAHGFYDDTIIGNMYTGCEADSNSGTGYLSVRATTRSVYTNCYSETAPFFNLSPRCLVLGMQGNISPNRTYGGAYFGAMPSGEGLFYKPAVFAETEVIGNVLGDASAPGKAMRVSELGIDWRMNAGQGLTRLTASVNYMQLDVGGTQAALWCAMDVTGNLRKGVHWAVGGVAFGSQSAILGSGSAPPTSGFYDRGAIWLNDSPAAGGKVGWVCVAGGTPGTWKAWGAIDA